jgi:hypothetical protein
MNPPYTAAPTSAALRILTAEKDEPTMHYLFLQSEKMNGRRSLEHASSDSSQGSGQRKLVIAIALTLTTAFPAALRGQDTTRVSATQSADSLAARLKRAEEAIALLREQMAAQAEASVQSASRVRVELFGRVLANGFMNTDSVNNNDVPQFAAPSGGRDQGGMGGAIRQTSFGVRVDVPSVIGARFNGELHADFFGGQQVSVGGRHFPLLRLRTARGVLAWARGELMFGQEVPLIAGVNPVSVASFGTSEFASAGNLWLWLPQVRGSWTLWTPLGLALQGAVLAPTTGDPIGTFDTGLDAAERSNRPYLQTRMRMQWGSEDARAEIGAGVHRGWVKRGDGALVSSRAVAVDALIPLGRFLEVRGEWYGGQALRGLGGGGIGQNLTTTGLAVRDRGGWGQVIVRPSTIVDLGAGCGVGDPKDVADLPARRLRNVACEAHVTAHPGGPVVMSLGWRGHRTTYEAIGVARNTHVNLALGFEF